MQAGICTALALLHDIVALVCLPATLASAAMSALYRTHLMCMASTWKMLRGRYGKGASGATKPGVSGIRPGQPEDLQEAPGVEGMLGKPKGIQVWRVWNIQLSNTGTHPGGCSGTATR